MHVHARWNTFLEQIRVPSEYQLPSREPFVPSRAYPLAPYVLIRRVFLAFYGPAVSGQRSSTNLEKRGLNPMRFARLSFEVL